MQQQTSLEDFQNQKDIQHTEGNDNLQAAKNIDTIKSSLHFPLEKVMVMVDDSLISGDHYKMEGVTQRLRSTANVENSISPSLRSGFSCETTTTVAITQNPCQTQQKKESPQVRKASDLMIISKHNTDKKQLLRMAQDEVNKTRSKTIVFTVDQDLITQDMELATDEQYTAESSSPKKINERFHLQVNIETSKEYVQKTTEQLKSVTAKTLSNANEIIDFTSTKSKATLGQDIQKFQTQNSNRYLKQQHYQQSQHPQLQQHQSHQIQQKQQQHQQKPEQSLLGHSYSPYFRQKFLDSSQRNQTHHHPRNFTKPYDKPCQTSNIQLKSNRKTLLPTPRKTLLEPVNKIKPLMPELENSSFTDSNIMLIKAIKLGIKQRATHRN